MNLIDFIKSFPNEACYRQHLRSERGNMDYSAPTAKTNRIIEKKTTCVESVKNVAGELALKVEQLWVVF